MSMVGIKAGRVIVVVTGPVKLAPAAQRVSKRRLQGEEVAVRAGFASIAARNRLK
jgi:hypothetical protein